MDWIVSVAHAGVRLDKFLADATRLGSRKRASVALDRAKVFLNDVEAAPDAGATRLATGDRVRVWMDRPGSARRRSPVRAGDLHILFEDESLVVPTNQLACLPCRSSGRIRGLGGRSAHHAFSPAGQRKPLVVHRIDRDTSGLVVFAKTTSAQHAPATSSNAAPSSASTAPSFTDIRSRRPASGATDWSGTRNH
jgi:23S rRNA pseudouridine1911/1915/1917 synthase